MRLWLVIFLLDALVLPAQNERRFLWPLDSPLTITGNYGEIRPNHFHAGVDFSTNGKTGLPVYAVDDGYVSRIRASAVGYGKSLYITHPGGRVSVYAHLSSFSLKTEKVIRQEQLKARSFEMDHYPPPHTIHVRAGEVIGLSGNSGGSTGPHLHFEIRDEISEVPLNVLKFYHYHDRIPPFISQLAFFDLSDTLNPKLIKTLKVTTAGVVNVTLPAGMIGLAFSGYDKNRLNGNSNNIYAARIFNDDQLVYEHHLDGIAFSESRYVNEFVHPAGGLRFQKCFVPALYPGNIYQHLRNRGRITLEEKKDHRIRMEFADEKNNLRTITVTVKAAAPSISAKSNPRSGKLLDCSRDHLITRRNSRLHIPAKTFYSAVDLTVDDRLEATGKIVLGPGRTNFSSAAALAVKVPERFAAYGKKVVLRSGSGVSVGIPRRDSLIFMVREMGQYEMAIDTVPPRLVVHPYSARHKEPWKLSSFSFLLNDNFSGIGKYDLYLNNVWVLAEYDAKNRLLTYYFDDDSPFGLLQFRLEAEDRVGNRETLFYLLKK